MKSKIEKLEIFFKKEDVSFEKVVIEKINQIVDHLNSQDQEEEITIPTEGLSEEVREKLKRTDEILQETRYGNQFYQQRRNL